MDNKELKPEDFENPELKKTVTKENNLKTLLVDYVGTVKNPEDGGVTLEMIIEVLSEEFPEFVLAIAEENFMRGYEQALTDIENVDVQEVQDQTEESNE